MTCDEAHALYRPLRALADRLLAKAVGTYHQTDKARGQPVAPVVRGHRPATLAMLNDIALFEPSRRGRIARGAFWQRRGKGLGPSDLALAKA